VLLSSFLPHEGNFGKDSCNVVFLLLTQQQVDTSNRGHIHLVLCHSSKAVPSGKLCAIHSNCPEARACLRRIDVSNVLCVFEFNVSEEAEAMLAASIPNTTTTKPQAFFWTVDAIDTNHIGHSQPYRECEKNLYLTYAMKTTAKALANSGCSAGDIADYLSSRGCTGTLTEARLKYHVDDVRKDMEDYTAVPKPNESDAEALIRMLTEKNASLFTCTPTCQMTKSLHVLKWLPQICRQ
jgi:hypothetical protein